MAEVTAPVEKCPECGARGTLATRGWKDQNTNTVECDPVRSDRVNPDRGGCGYTFDVEHIDEEAQAQAELEAEVQALREELASASADGE